MTPQSLPKPVPRGRISVPPGVTDPTLTSTHPPLNDGEKDVFESLKAAFADERVALMRVSHDGVPRAVMAIVVETPTGGADLFPVALMMDEALFVQMSPPPGSEPVNS